MDLKELFDSIKDYVGKTVTVDGWIRNHRDQKTFGFIDFSDGTTMEHLQIVYDEELDNFLDIKKLLVGCAIEVTGTIVESSGNQAYEMKAQKVTLMGDCPEEYPIQPKRHTREYLRSVAYLRPYLELEVSQHRLFTSIFKVIIMFMLIRR